MSVNLLTVKGSFHDLYDVKFELQYLWIAGFGFIVNKEDIQILAVVHNLNLDSS